MAPGVVVCWSGYAPRLLRSGVVATVLAAPTPGLFARELVLPANVEVG